jgi:hypothetical protein
MQALQPSLHEIDARRFDGVIECTGAIDPDGCGMSRYRKKGGRLEECLGADGGKQKQHFGVQRGSILFSNSNFSVSHSEAFS